MPCYFNVVGSHRGPDSAQAVTPRFVDALAEGDAPNVHGVGWQTRDFLCADVVRATLR